MASASLGRYKITRELGRGAMGRVYLAHDPEIDRPVAVKTVEAFETLAPGRQDEARRQFMAEARAAGKLLHPAIVTLFDAGESDGTLYLAMEYVEGETLEYFTAPEDLLPVPVVVEMIAGAAEALDYAHRAGVIHRDIKPANLMRVATTSVKIMDFGLAGPIEAQLTGDGSLLGTPAYMSPEHVRDQPVDGRSDLFSLAVVLYELLTGRRPFAGGSVSSIIYRIVNEPPASIDPSDDRVSPGLREFLERVLVKRPEDRIPDGASFAAALREAGGLIVNAGPDAMAGPSALPGASAQDPALTASAPGTPPSRGRAARKRERGARSSGSRVGRGRGERRRRSRVPLGLTMALLLVVAAAAWWFREELPNPFAVREEKPAQSQTRPPSPPQMQPGSSSQTPTQAPAQPQAQATPVAPTWLETTVRTEPAGLEVLLDGTPLDAASAGVVRFPVDGPLGTLTATRDCRSAEHVLDPRDADGEVVLVLDDPTLSYRLDLGVAGVEVRVNDTLAGTAPLDLALDLCRENRIDLTADGYRPAQATIVALAMPLETRTQLARLTLVEIPKGLVRLPRFAEVQLIWYVDGDRLGEGRRELELPEGEHELRIKNEYHYIDETRTIDVVGGITSNAPIAIPDLAELVVQAYPPNCKVYLRRPGARWRHVDDTPFRRKVAVGDFEVRIQLIPTGETQERKIRLAPGDNPPIRVSFGRGRS